MSNIKFLTVSAILIIAAVMTTGCTSPNTDDAKASLAIQSDDYVFGNKNADITLFEYSDFECPFCRKFHGTAELLVDEFDGQVNWVYRHFPLSFHDPAATNDAQAAECAGEVGGNDKFWEYAELIYTRTPANGKGIDKNTLVEMAKELNLDEDKFEACVDSNRHKDKIRQNFKEGADLGVSGTPATFVVNNKTGESKFVSGNQSFEGMKSIIEGML